MSGSFDAKAAPQALNQAQALRCIVIGQLADLQSVEAQDHIVSQPEIGTRGLRLPVGPGKSMQIAV